jgi:hypothetical protein
MVIVRLHRLYGCGSHGSGCFEARLISMGSVESSVNLQCRKTPPDDTVNPSCIGGEELYY